jgi:hypothetical protein
MSPPRLTPEQIQNLMYFYGDPQAERAIAERPYEAPIARPVIEPLDIVIPPRDQISPPRTLPSSDIADFQAGQMLIPVEGADALARSVAQARQARAGGGAAVPPPPAPPAPAAAPGDTARARVDMETGSQGRTTPSNAADAASVGTRISKYLEQAVGRLSGEQQGFGDIANALMQVRATGGKVNFEQAMRDIEAKDFNRATNLANAYAALKRADGSGQLSLKDQALIEQRKLDRAAREGNQAAVQLNNAINSAVKDYSRADQPRIREEIMTTIAAWRLSNEGRDASPAQVPEIMRDVLNHVNRLGYRRVGGGGGGEGAAGPSGGGIYMDGEVQRFRPFVPQGRGGLSQQQQAANRALERGDEQTALSIARNIEDKAAGRGRGGGGGGGGQLSAADESKVVTRLGSANSTLMMIDRAKSLVAGGAPVGLAEKLSTIAEGVRAQAKIILGSDDNRLNAALRSAQNGLDFVIAADKTGETGRAFSWLTSKSSADAQRLKSVLTMIAYSLAKTMDSGGQLSNGDVQNAMRTIGQSGSGILTSPNNLIAALEEVANLTRSNAYSQGMSANIPEDRIMSILDRRPPPAAAAGAGAAAGGGGGGGGSGAPPPDLRGLSNEELMNRLQAR